MLSGIGLCYNIAHFSYPSGADKIFPTVVAQARAAEAAGFDTFSVIDHFSQPPIGGPDVAPIVEAYTTLAAVATATSSIGLTTMVSGNTFRNPALLAKMATTLDLVSGGRAMLGIGAGWYEPEHREYGFEFGTVAERFERFAESLEIISKLLRGETTTVDGKWYRTEGANNEPRLRDDLPILIGGAGARKTFGLAAKYASHLDILCPTSELPGKLDALERRCEEQGRARSSITTSNSGMVFIDEDGAAARAGHRDFLRTYGIDPDALDGTTYALVTGSHFVGTPDEVAEQVQQRVLKVGVDGFSVTAPVNGHVPGIVELIGNALRPLFSEGS